MTLNDELNKHIKEAEEIIYSFMPDIAGYQKSVIEAMDYSVRAGGKRIRPMILLECYRVLGGKSEIAKPFAAAIEMIHTYSLVHDDLPAMDNDTLRRGKNTTWVEYGEAMAILAGDALLNYAYETAAKSFVLAASLEERLCVAKAFAYFSQKAGIYGMVGGQCVDVQSEKEGIPLDKDKLSFIHNCKTGALLQSAFVTGAILAGASDDVVQKLETAAACVGMAFQIKDDILDVTGDEQVLGKNVGSDAVSGKETYVDLYGIDESKEHVRKYTDEAMEIINTLALNDSFLARLVESLVDRKA